MRCDPENRGPSPFHREKAHPFTVARTKRRDQQDKWIADMAVRGSLIIDPARSIFPDQADSISA